MSDIDFLKQAITKGLISILIEERGATVQEALRLLQESRTFDLVMNEETGLYRESPAYVYELLKKELIEA